MIVHSQDYSPTRKDHAEVYEESYELSKGMQILHDKIALYEDALRKIAIYSDGIDRIGISNTCGILRKIAREALGK